MSSGKYTAHLSDIREAHRRTKQFHLLQWSTFALFPPFNLLVFCRSRYKIAGPLILIYGQRFKKKQVVVVLFVCRQRTISVLNWSLQYMKITPVDLFWKTLIFVAQWMCLHLWHGETIKSIGIRQNKAFFQKFLSFGCLTF